MINDDNMTHTIKEFISSTNRISEITRNSISIKQSGGFVNFKNNLDVPVYLTKKNRYRMWRKNFRGQWEKKEDVTTNKNITISTGKTFEWINKEKKEHSFKTDIDVTFTLNGVGEIGKDITPEIDMTFQKQWENLINEYGYYILIIIIIIISLIVGYYLFVRFF